MKRLAVLNLIQSEMKGDINTGTPVLQLSVTSIPYIKRMIWLVHQQNCVVKKLTRIKLMQMRIRFNESGYYSHI
jgi:hypothetical protein